MQQVISNYLRLTKLCKIVGALLFTMLIIGCTSDVARMQRYSADNYNSQNQSVIVLGTKNISFIDLTKYTKSAPLVKVAVTETAQAHQLTTTVKKATVKKNNDTPASADPNNVTYPKVDLRALLKSHDKKETTVLTTEEKQVKAAESTTHTPTEAINSYRILKSNRMLNVFGYATSTYVVEPGVYYISYAYKDAEGTAFYTKDPGLNTNNEVVYGAFEVKAGEVVFLGDIEIDWLRTNAEKVKISGDIETVKRELVNAEQQALAAKIKQAPFYAAGYKIPV